MGTSVEVWSTILEIQLVIGQPTAKRIINKNILKLNFVIQKWLCSYMIFFEEGLLGEEGGRSSLKNNKPQMILRK